MALDANDGERLFRVIDVRSRHALHSIFEDGRQARAAIEADYPPEARADALAALGPDVPSAAALFAARCAAACRQRFAAKLGAPVAERDEGNERVVETTRGELRLHREGEGNWWGLVYETAALDAERDRASRDRRRIEANAATFRRRAELAAER
ncbi:MAG: hypothetical protein AAF411_19300 [Myxococcota bacterium]